MAFVKTNPNPHGSYVGDCVIRALSIATGKTWSEVYTELALKGLQMCDMPSSNQVWGAYLKDNGYFVIDMMPHESGRIGQISTAEDWFRWADRFALNNKNIDVVLEGTSWVPHFQMMLEEAGILKREIQEMRDIEGTSHRCHE